LKPSDLKIKERGSNRIKQNFDLETQHPHHAASPFSFGKGREISSFILLPSHGKLFLPTGRRLERIIKRDIQPERRPT